MIFVLLLAFTRFVECQSNTTSVFVTEDSKQLLGLQMAIMEFTPEPIPKIAEAEKDEDDRFFFGSKPEALKILPNSRMGNEWEARNILRYASVAYCPLATISYWRCATCNGSTYGTTDVVPLSNENAEAYGYLAVNHHQHIIVISIRGSDGLFDWFSNIKVAQVGLGLPYPFADAKVHQGFNDFADSIFPKLRLAFARAVQRNPSYKVIFTGHSKGGAVASILAVKLIQYNLISWNKVHIYTYGMPRVGNPAFANYINSMPLTILRVTSYADMVPVVPKILYEYQHFQYNLHITSDKRSYTCSIYEEDSECTNDYWIPSIDAHYSFWDLRINSSCN